MGKKSRPSPLSRHQHANPTPHLLDPTARSGWTEQNWPVNLPQNTLLNRVLQNAEKPGGLLKDPGDIATILCNARPLIRPSMRLPRRHLVTARGYSSKMQPQGAHLSAVSPLFAYADLR